MSRARANAEVARRSNKGAATWISNATKAEPRPPAWDGGKVGEHPMLPSKPPGVGR